MSTATCLRSVDWPHGDARLFALDPPMAGRDGDVARFVIVCAVPFVHTGPETYILACDQDEVVASWEELDGSFRGGLDHTQALENAGYDVAPLAAALNGGTDGK